MRNVSNNSCRENRHTHCLCSDSFSENRAVCENVNKYGGAIRRRQYRACVWHTRYVRLYARTQAHAHAQTHTHTAFSRQQWFHAGASVLHYTYIARLFVTHYIYIYIYISQVLQN